MIIDEPIAEALVHTRVSDKPDELRHQLCEYLPRSQMTQNKHYRNACAKFARHRFDVVDLHPLEDFFWRHLREFCAAKQVCAEPPEVAAYEATQFAGRLFIGKGNLHVSHRQASIIPGKRPGAEPEELPENKEKWQR